MAFNFVLAYLLNFQELYNFLALCLFCSMHFYLQEFPTQLATDDSAVLRMINFLGKRFVINYSSQMIASHFCLRVVYRLENMKLHFSCMTFDSLLNFILLNLKGDSKRSFLNCLCACLFCSPPPLCGGGGSIRVCMEKLNHII